MQRADAIERLKTEAFDVLIIGGGATGTGIALDASTRGFRVALVERYDFASGTSSRSTKLIHGGVRYLEQAVKKLDSVQYQLVRHALAERATFLKIAPHLTRRVALLTPSYSRWEQLYYWAGLKLYDLLAGRRNLGSTKLLSRRASLATFPGMRETGLVGAVLYYDGQFDDARMNIALASTAERAGAAIANYIEVVGLPKADGRVAGAQVRDHIGHTAFEIKARVVINATGPFTDSVRRLDDAAAQPMLRTSSGVHIVVAGDLCPPDTGMLIPKTDDGRVLFVLPWLGKTVIGTTDEPAEPVDHPAAHEAEIDYLLKHVSRYLKQPPRADQVLAAWCGLRPLVAGDSGHAGGTAKLARDHVIRESESGLVTVTGGKWTTYRLIASDAVDHLVNHRGLVAKAPCITDQLRLIGGERYRSDGDRALVERFGIDPDVADHLNHAYGDRAEQVAALAADGLGKRLADGHANIEAEVVWAAREEYAQGVMDVLARRLRLAFLDRVSAERSVPRVAELLGGVLSWDDERREREIVEAMERLRSGL